MRSEFVYDIQLPCLGVDHPGRYVDALVTQGLWTPARKGGHDGWWVTTRLPKPTRNRPGLRYMFDRLVTWWGRKCVYCGAAEGRLEIEHIVPVARGGSNRRQNLTIACRPCNLQKGTLTAAEFGHPDVHERAKGIH
jgi:5-methylcytosine-specific restriction endonuclease McrA